MACGLQPSTTATRAEQAKTNWSVKVRGIYDAKVGATDGNDKKHTRDKIDYDTQNLIKGWLYSRVAIKKKIPKKNYNNEYKQTLSNMY